MFSWIEIAMENGGRIDIQYIEGTFTARMRFPHRKVIIGRAFNRLSDALESLNDDLGDDAANEMIESGAV